MEKGILIKESASVRFLLEQHLTTLFSGDGVNKYITDDAGGTEMPTMLMEANNQVAFPQMKLAYNVWLGMLTADRNAVLVKFYALYANLCGADAGKGKTLSFCALFINEFAGIIATAMQRPINSRLHVCG